MGRAGVGCGKWWQYDHWFSINKKKIISHLSMLWNSDLSIRASGIDVKNVTNVNGECKPCESRNIMNVYTEISKRKRGKKVG